MPTGPARPGAPVAQRPRGAVPLRIGPPPHVRVRRAATLLLLTLAVPGSAQWIAGNRRIARAALGVVAGCASLAVLLGIAWLADAGAVLGLATDSTALRLLAALLVLAGLAEAALLTDAWRLGRPATLPRRARPFVAAGAVLAVVLVGTLSVGGARRAWAGAGLIDEIFHDGAAARATDGRYTVLLLGGDAGPDRVGTRPDSVTLASIDASSGRTVLFSLPRNLEDVPFRPGSAASRALPGGWSCGDACLLNAVYTWGAAHAQLFPGARDPGAAAMKDAVAGVTGLPVDYYVLIDLQGFRRLVDAMGGITVTVRAPVPIGGGTSPIKGWIRPGTRHLDGFHALWFARSREGASDYARMQRQRCVMNAMLGQLDPARALAHFEEIAAASSHVVSTDLPSGELGHFVGLASGARGQPLTSVQFVPPLLDPAHPDLAALRSKVAATLAATRRPAAPAPGPSRTPTAPAASPSPSSQAALPVQPEASDARSVCTPG